MQEINFLDGYYGAQKYSEDLPQLKMLGVNYNQGSLVFNLVDENKKVYEKQTRDPLEMLVLSEVLYGSPLWNFLACCYTMNTYNSSRKAIAIKVKIDDSYINDYKDNS